VMVRFCELADIGASLLSTACAPLRFTLPVPADPEA
jgi:hypothetical protein